MKFLQLNVNDDCNYGMSGADNSDQIRGYYCFDHWLRNYKWWHSMFWWGVQVLMVNYYQWYCESHKGIQETLMNQCECQKMKSLFWLDKQYFDNKPPRSTQDNRSICTLSITSSTVRICESARSRILASALNPLTGALRGRLNRGTAHWPLNPSFAGIRKAEWQMHWWVIGKQKYNNVEFANNIMWAYARMGVTSYFIHVGILNLKKRI